MTRGKKIKIVKLEQKPDNRQGKKYAKDRARYKMKIASYPIECDENAHYVNAIKKR